jgi:hypothetical protein
MVLPSALSACPGGSAVGGRSFVDPGFWQLTGGL